MVSHLPIDNTFCGNPNRNYRCAICKEKYSWNGFALCDDCLDKELTLPRGLSKDNLSKEMTETLEKKLDKIISFDDEGLADVYPSHIQIIKDEINKALQEFREQIEAMKEEHMFLDGYKGACIDVLALIGEKKQ